MRGFIRDIRRAANVEAPGRASLTYAATLNPEVIDQYREKGFCLVVTMSLIRGRAENARVPGALKPTTTGWSASRSWSTSRRRTTRARSRCRCTSTSPTTTTRRAFNRPGPEINVYRLNNCRQQTGKVPNEPVGTKGLDKGIGSSFVQGGGD